MCFLDFNKAFDKVSHDHLIDFLKKKTLDKKDIRIIYNLYYNQTATVDVENELSNYIEIKRVVRQGCVL